MKKKFSAFLLAFTMLLSSCGAGTAVTESGGADETDAADETEGRYKDYVTGEDAVVAEFSPLDISPGRTTDEASGEYDCGLCVVSRPVDGTESKSALYYCDLIMGETPGAHAQNGILGLVNGERVRVCPEKDCGADDICTHIVFSGEEEVSFGKYLYICGRIPLDGGFYPKTCVMRYDTETREYVKYAEFDADGVSLSVSGGYLFASAVAGEKSAVLYCFDLLDDRGYRLVYSSKHGTPTFLGAAGGYILMHDGETLSLLDGVGETAAECEVRGDIADSDVCGGMLYFTLEGGGLYRFDPSTAECAKLLDLAYRFDIYDGVLYYLEYREMAGLEYLVPFEGAGGQIEYKIEDYPVKYGGAVYFCSLADADAGAGAAEAETLFTVGDGRYLSGGLNVSSCGLIYEYFISTDEPQRVFPAATAVRDTETGEETILTEYWNGRERSY